MQQNPNVRSRHRRRRHRFRIRSTLGAGTHQTIRGAPPLNEQGELTNIHDWLKPAQHAWHQSVQWDTVPWHGIDKARQGAVATFLGITIQPNDDHTLKIQSIAVGDCELFVIDPDDQVTLKVRAVRGQTTLISHTSEAIVKGGCQGRRQNVPLGRSRTVSPTGG